MPCGGLFFFFFFCFSCVFAHGRSCSFFSPFFSFFLCIILWYVIKVSECRFNVDGSNKANARILVVNIFIPSSVHSQVIVIHLRRNESVCMQCISLWLFVICLWLFVIELLVGSRCWRADMWWLW
jgi:hypothetical protein